MKILVINSGSSSLKYQLIDMENEEVLCKGNYERIGGESFFTHKINGEKYLYEIPVKNHEEALQNVLEKLVDEKVGAIKNVDEIDAIGHRVVNGGDILTKTTLVTDDVIEKFKDTIVFAPLHNPAALAGVKACVSLMKDKPNVLVFDTSFHTTMKPAQYIYPIPYEYYEKYHIRKYGAHGISHMYVAERLAELKGVPQEGLNMINCHLGQGASLCAIKDGKCVDTSMGLTPVAGIPMGSRSGDLDPSVVTYIMRKENLTPDEMDDILNHKSGIYGVSQIGSADFRDVEAKVFKDDLDSSKDEIPFRADIDENCKLALDIYYYDVASYIARYFVALGRVDCISFTAGVGERGIEDRVQICKRLEVFGIKLDREANNQKTLEGKISTPDSKVELWVVPTNEELEIARETKDVVNYL